MRWSSSILRLLLALVLGLAAASATADDPAEIVLEAGRPLAEALETLRDLGIEVVYSTRLVRPKMRLGERRAGTPEDVLQAILAPHGLKAQSGPNDTWVVVEDAGRLHIRGRVASRDAIPLPGVRVLVLDHEASVRTDAGGAFELMGLGAGDYVLEARMPGFVIHRTEPVKVTAGTVAEIEIVLTAAPVTGEEIVVIPSYFEILKMDPESRQNLSRDEVRRLPHLADDLYRTVSWLPGTVGGDISADFHVRGGETEEILVMVDGMELYAPYHLKELNIFSTVDAEAVGGVDFLTGGFPAEYGDRMSGVLDISGLEPNGRRRTALGVSFVNAGVLSAGTFDEADGQSLPRGQWLVSARRGYLDIVLDIANQEDEIDPVYYDLLGQVRYRLSERHELSSNVHAAYDVLDFITDEGDESVDAEDYSVYLWSRLTSTFSKRLYAGSVLSWSRLSRDRNGTDDDYGSFGTLSDRREFKIAGLKQDWGFEASPRHFLKWGYEAQDVSGDYDFESFSAFTQPIYTGGPPTERRREVEASPEGSALSVYLADRFRLSDALTFELGGRWDRQTYTGGDEQWSPRFNLAYTFGTSGEKASGHSFLRLAWGLFHQSQGIHELQAPDGEREFFAAQRSEHRLLSFEHVLSHGQKPWSGMSFRVEAYQKVMTNLRPRYENLFNTTEFLREVQPDRVRVAPERAEARGFEVMVKQPGRGYRSWWVSYAWARVEDEIDGVMVPRGWDQRHTVTFSVNWEREKWSFNLAGVYHTGWPTTPVGIEMVEGVAGGLVPISVVGARNTSRLSDFRRVDFRASRELRQKRGVWTFFVEVSNALDRDNVCCVEAHFLVADRNGELSIYRDEDYWLPFIPSFGVRWEF